MPKMLVRFLGFSATLLLACISFSFAQKFTISGFIRDSETGETLIGANIYDRNSKMGTSANNYGFYSLSLDSDSVDLMVTFIGYEAISKIFFIVSNLEFNFELHPGTLLEGVIITSEERIEQTTEMSTIRIPIKQLQALPAILGENDVLKILQLLPGVQSGVEGASGIYVRGGGPDQNLILLDGVPIYNAAHLFGGFSIFNSDAINNIKLIKGGFPARYGGRLSSVVDVSMKEGNTKEFKVFGSIGLISSKIAIEGPIKNENTSYILSLRRTYLDLIIRPIIKYSTDGNERAGYHFHDINFKINRRFSNNDRIFLSFYTGRDKAFSKYKDYNVYDGTRYDYDEEFQLGWGNVITALRWNHIFNPKLFSNVTLTFNKYDFKIENNSRTIETTPSEVMEENYYSWYSSGINDFTGKIDFDFLPNPYHTVRFGTNLIRHEFLPGAAVFKSNVEIDTTFGALPKLALEGSAYLEDDLNLGQRTKVNLGIHGSYFLVDDEFYFSIQPRLSLRILLMADISFKASYALMTQYIHLLTNSGIGLPTDLWVPSTAKIKPQNASQIAAGFAKSFDVGLEVTVEGYYKTMDNLISYQEGASYLNITDDWQSKVTSGSGESYGAELFVQKKIGRLSGWIGYTLSWTNRQFEDLNFGRKFPYKYDRRHDISLVGVYELSDGIQLSGNWVYGTGNSLSLPHRVYMGYDDFSRYFYAIINHYEERNSFRMRAYHRLDINVDFTKEKKWGERTWSLGFYNLYNRQNPFYVDIEEREGKKHFIQYSLFPIIPTISYSFKF